MSAPQSDVLNIETYPISEEKDIGVIAWVTINRPEKLNALNSEVMSSIKAMVAWAESTDSVRWLWLQVPSEPTSKESVPNRMLCCRGRYY